MPGGDRTGPAGMGPMTGRGAGFCAGFGVPGFMNRLFGPGFFGWGRGRRGGGRGWRNMFYATGLTGWQRAALGWPAWGFGGPHLPGQAAPFGAVPPTKEQELQWLKRQAEFLSRSLEDIQKRIDELQGQAPQP